MSTTTLLTSTVPPITAIAVTSSSQCLLNINKTVAVITMVAIRRPQLGNQQLIIHWVGTQKERKV